MLVQAINFVCLSLAVMALSFGLAACGVDEDQEAPPGEVELDLVVGDSVPLTGELEAFGSPGQKAANLAVAQIRRAATNSDARHQVELVHEDNESNPRVAVRVARRMIEDDGATCLAGPWGPRESAQTFESTSSPERVLQIIPTSVGDALGDPDDPDGLLNYAALASTPQGSALADYVAKELGGAEGETVNVGARDDAYGTGIAEVFRIAWEDKGGTVGEEVLYDPEQPDYESEANEIVSGNPEAFIIVDLPDTYDKVGPALLRTGKWDPKKTFVTDGLVATELPSMVGEEATEGIRATAPGAPDKGPAATAFDRAYREAEPKALERQTFDAQNFDAVILCYLAAVAAGSTEGSEMAAHVPDITSPPGEKFTWEQLPDAIRALQSGKEINYLGASGEIDMDEEGNATAGVYDIYRYRGGELEPVDEISATAEPESSE
jgi:ABC-type branched-subunit amino acid transport system substrate-binding protein